jgi:hypothetical protein
VRRERHRSGQSVQVDVDEVEILIPFEDVTPKYGMSIRNEHLLEIDQIWKGIDCITNDEVREVVWRSIDLLARGQRTHSLFNRFIYFWDSVELVVNFLWESARPRSNRTEKIREIIALSRDMTENNCLRKATAIRDLLETPWRNKVSNFLKLYFPTRFEEMMSNMDRLYCTRNGIVHIRSHEFSVEDYERVEAQTNLMKRMAQEFTNAVIRTSI